MPVLPIPMIIALVLFAFLAHRMATRETHATLLALIGICAVQGVIVSLVQYYGVTVIRPVQPLLASIIPAVAWLAFRQAAGGATVQRDIAIHSTGLVLAPVFCSSPAAAARHFDPNPIRGLWRCHAAAAGARRRQPAA